MISLNLTDIQFFQYKIQLIRKKIRLIQCYKDKIMYKVQIILYRTKHQLSETLNVQYD